MNKRLDIVFSDSCLREKVTCQCVGKFLCELNEADILPPATVQAYLCNLPIREVLMAYLFGSCFSSNDCAYWYNIFS